MNKVQSIEAAAAKRISAAGIDKVSDRDREMIAADFAAIHGVADVVHYGTTEFGVPCMTENEKEAVAGTVATLFLREQGYDVDENATYDDVADRLGADAEDVYQEVFCLVAYEIAGQQFRL